MEDGEHMNNVSSVIALYFHNTIVMFSNLRAVCCPAGSGGAEPFDRRLESPRQPARR